MKTHTLQYTPNSRSWSGYIASCEEWSHSTDGMVCVFVLKLICKKMFVALPSVIYVYMVNGNVPTAAF